MFLCWTALAICWLTKRSSILSACLHCALVLPSLWNSDNTNILLWISLNKAVCGGSGICQVFLISPNFIYFQKSMHILFSFFFACARSSWTFSSCGAWTLHCGGFSCCRVWAQGTTGFWSCREWDLLAPHHMRSSWTRKQTHVPWIGMQILNPRTNMDIPSNFCFNWKCTTFCPTHSVSLVYESVFIDMLKIRTEKEHVRREVNTSI